MRSPTRASTAASWALARACAVRHSVPAGPRGIKPRGAPLRPAPTPRYDTALRHPLRRLVERDVAEVEIGDRLAHLQDGEPGPDELGEFAIGRAEQVVEQRTD